MISYIDSLSQERFMGNIDAPMRYQWRTFGDTDTARLIPRETWKPLIDALPGGILPEWPYLPPVHDQNGVGQCNADATTSAMEAQQLKQGLPLAQLSSGDLYHRINGGSDRGSLLEDGLREAFNGVATIADCGSNIWRKGGWRPGTSQQRRPHRLLEAFVCPTFDHCVSAVLQGFDLISGILWGSNYTPDAEGWLPSTRRGGGGHAVHGFKPTYRGNTFGIWHNNSWSNNWGHRWGDRGGLCAFPESAYSGPVGGWWAVRQVSDHGGAEPPRPIFYGAKHAKSLGMRGDVSRGG